MSKFAIFATWDDVPHLSEEAKASLMGAYLPHERAARTKGVPSLGAGAIYPVPEADILVKPFPIPAFWKHVFGMDVGWNRTAAVWAAIDPENDVAYLYSEYYRGQAEPSIHAEAIKSRGSWIPGVIDPASQGRSQNDGTQLLNTYQQQGLTNLTKANNAVEAGLYQVWQRLSSGRLKVFDNLQNWLAEYRIYRRDEKGAIVKKNDHLMDCTRYTVMSGISIAAYRSVAEFAQRSGIGGRTNHQIDYDPLTIDTARGGAPTNSAANYDPLRVDLR